MSQPVTDVMYPCHATGEVVKHKKCKNLFAYKANVALWISLQENKYVYRFLKIKEVCNVVMGMERGSNDLVIV